MIFIQWILLFIPSLLLELVGYTLNPIAALFVTKRLRTDKAKRLGSGQHTFEHEYLQKYVYWFQTHDNAVDEYWYGLYNEKSFFPYVKSMTQERYDNSWFARYVMRVMWMYRNNAYGIQYNLIGKPDRRGDTFKKWSYGEEDVDRFWIWLEVWDKSGFQLKARLPLFPKIGKFDLHNDLNIGWKDHRSAVNCLYANRIIGIRTH